MKDAIKTGFYGWDNKEGLVIKGSTKAGVVGAEDIPFAEFQQGMGKIADKNVPEYFEDAVLEGRRKPEIVDGRFKYDNSVFDTGKTAGNVEINDPESIISRLAGDDDNSRLMEMKQTDLLKKQNLAKWNKLADEMGDKPRPCFDAGHTSCLGGVFGKYAMKYISRQTEGALEDIFKDPKNFKSKNRWPGSGYQMSEARRRRRT